MQGGDRKSQLCAKVSPINVFLGLKIDVIAGKVSWSHGVRLVGSKVSGRLVYS